MTGEHGTFFWNELMTRDVEAAKAFYGEALGWTFDEMPMGDDGSYWVCKSGDKTVGGIFSIAGSEFEGAVDHWHAYIAVDDVDARVEKAKAKGGKLQRPLFDVPEIGRIAMLEDKTGAEIGWITPAPQG